jgi:hypothetical protein
MLYRHIESRHQQLDWIERRLPRSDPEFWQEMLGEPFDPVD